MADYDLPLYPELPGQLSLDDLVGIARCDAPGCDHSAVWQLRPVGPVDVVALLCDAHLPLVVDVVDGSLRGIG